MKKDITGLYCFVDDFCQGLDEHLKTQAIEGPSPKNKTRLPDLTLSEMITIMLLFQESPCRHFKYFYQSYLQLYKKDFPGLVSYERFVALQPRILGHLAMLLVCLLRPSKGIAYVDSTSLAVCHPKRISRNKVCRDVAKLGKTTKGWFFGFKLHLIIDDQGNLVRCHLTPGNIDDRAVTPSMTQGLTGLLFGDKGYLSKKLFLSLYHRGLKLITGIKKTMKNILLPFHEKILLRKRSLVETVFDYLKNKMMLEHTRHRSLINMFIHILSTLISYQLKSSKPSLNHFFLNP